MHSEEGELVLSAYSKLLKYAMIIVKCIRKYTNCNLVIANE